MASKNPVTRMASKDRDVMSKQTEAEMKQRIKDLEKQVSELKHKQEELRRAKNSMVVKREREVLQVGEPFGQRGAEAEKRAADLQKKLSQMEEQHSNELKKLHAEHTKALADNSKLAKESDCGHGPLIMSLQDRVSALETENTVLRIDRDECMSQVDRLLLELSLKEAEWCEKEQSLKRELDKTWGEKYAEWMQKAESKIEELQHANKLLKELFDRQKARDVSRRSAADDE